MKKKIAAACIFVATLFFFTFQVGAIEQEGSAVSEEELRKWEESLSAASRLYQAGRYQAALDILDALDPSKMEELEMFRLNLTGLSHRNLGQYTEALESLEKALKIARKFEDDRRSEGICLSNIGLILNATGKYHDAIDRFEKAIEIHEQLPDQKAVGIDLSNLGESYMHFGLYAKALDAFHRSLKIMKTFQEKRGEGILLNNIGMAYHRLMLFESAEKYLKEAYDIHSGLDDRPSVAKDLNNMGLLMSDRGEYQHAKNYFEKSLEIFEQLGMNSEKAGVLLNIGTVYQDLKEYDKALDHLEKASEIALEIGDPRTQGAALSNIGKIHLSLENFELARKFLNESSALNEKIENRRSLAIDLKDLGTLSYKMGKADDAIDYYIRSIDIVESLKSSIEEKDYKISFMSEALRVYEDLIFIMSDLSEKGGGKDYEKKAFEIFERKQSRIFLEEMGRSAARNFGVEPADLKTQEIRLENMLEAKRRKLSEEQAQPDESANPDLISFLQNDIRVIKEDQRLLMKRIKKEDPAYYYLKNPVPASLAEIQEYLKPDETALSYCVTEEMTFLWVVNSKRLDFFRIDVGETYLSKETGELKELLQKQLSSTIFRESPEERQASIVEKNLESIRPILRELCDILIPKGARSVIPPSNNLLIVVTESLYELPFEALMVENDDKSVSYLVEKHPVVYLSSTSLIKILRVLQDRKKESPRYPLLAFAHPAIGTKENPCLSLAPEDDRENIDVGASIMKGYLETSSKLCELEPTQKEVEKISEILQAPAESDALHLRKKASKSALLALNDAGRLDDYKYVVFSCHGIIPRKNTNSLNQPALLLSHPDPADNTDGFLRMSDVFGLKFDADLIVLSACDTGRGKRVRGEGVMAFTRAFMYAGTPSVTITLWPVETYSSMELSTGFFENLKKGENRAESLRCIKLQMIQGKKGEVYKHPYYWAPMVIFGDR